MSKLRSISTSIWSDTWFESLDSNDKLLFIYLLTNDRTNMLGIYEISLRKISFDTGLNIETVRKALKGFAKGSKVFYKGSYIVMINFIKHQKFNPNMQKSAVDEFNILPNEIKPESLKEDVLTRDKKGFERLCKGFGTLSKVEVEVEGETEGEYKADEITPNLDFTINDFKENETQESWLRWLEYNYHQQRPINRVRQPLVKADLRKLATINNQPHEPTMRAIIKKCISMDWKNLQLTDDMKAELHKFKTSGKLH